MRITVTKPSKAARDLAERLLDEAGQACAAAIKGELPGMEPATALELVKALVSDEGLAERAEAALLASDWPAHAPGAPERARQALEGAGLSPEILARLRSYSSDGTL
jgi:predicted alpha/beta-hydrolase family hydrolase